MNPKITRLFALAAFVLLIGLYACSRSVPVDSNNSSTSDMFVPSNTSFVDYESYSQDVTEASLNQDFAVKTPTVADMPVPKVIPLPMILRALKLTPEQAATVKGYLQDYNDCVQPIIRQMLDEMKSIVQAARQARKDIMDQLKSGAITRQEALKDLRDLNIRMKNALEELRLKYCPEIARCMKQLIQSITQLIRETGTDAQKQQWQRFLDSLPAVPFQPPTSRN